MPTILHITPHLGGGAGKALSGITAYDRHCESDYHHRILILEEPEKDQFIKACRSVDVDVIISADETLIAREIEASDIVVLSWWHHPAMARFLSMFPPIPLRLVLWSHVSGCNYPMLPFEFASSVHKTLFTTYYSLDNPYWTVEQREKFKASAHIIYGLGELDAPLTGNAASCGNAYARRRADAFSIGYVGTLNYGKLHPDFVEYCKAVTDRIPDARFIMVGDRENSAAINERASSLGIADRFEFTGYTHDVKEELARFDLFGYPLNPWHFGTTENALLEACAAGVPVVALNQCTEKYLITHNETGLLADSKEHYAELIEYLYDHPGERERLGRNAQQYVKKEFSMKKNCDTLHEALDQVMAMAPRSCEFVSLFGSQPYQWFLSCLGADAPVFEKSITTSLMNNPAQRKEIEQAIKNCRPVLREKSKSSILHFARYFTDDEILQYWKGLVNG